MTTNSIDQHEFYLIIDNIWRSQSWSVSCQLS